MKALVNHAMHAAPGELTVGVLRNWMEPLPDDAVVDIRIEKGSNHTTIHLVAGSERELRGR